MPPPRRSSSAARAWLLVAPATLMLAWGGNHFTPLLHVYESDGGYATWQANLLLGLYVFGLVPGLLVASALSDKHGRKPVMILGAVLSLLGSLSLGVGASHFVLLGTGRVLAGIGVGVAMSVGTSWIKELSSPPFDLHAGPTAGALRPSLTLTLGSTIGALVAGCVAQWAPGPEVTPYIVHGALGLAALVLVCGAPESLPEASRSTEAWWRDLRVPSVAHRSFTRLVIPAAPWIFASAGVAYAVMPSLVEDAVGRWATLFATVLTVLMLGTGALVQNLVPMINRRTRGRGLVVGMSVMLLGMVLAVLAALTHSVVLVVVVAIVLGTAYGICVVAGLIIVQTVSTPSDLAGMTGIYYSLAYAGFLLPTVLAALLPLASYSTSLTAVALVCAVCLGLVVRGSRRHGIR